MQKQTSISDRILCTPSEYAQNHYLYAQEIGSLTSLKPHISRRNALSSYLFLCVEKGYGYFTYHGNKKILLAGDCVFIDCNEGYSHESVEEDPWTLKWVHFSGKEAPEFYQRYQSLHYDVVFRPAALTGFTEMLQAIYELYQSESTAAEFYSNCLLTSLIMQCFQCNESNQRAADLSKDSMTYKLRQVRQYINEHLIDDLSLDSLSKLFFISKYYLEREYKKEFGITIGNDITVKRISLAKKKLRFTGDTISKIAEDCGFSSAGYFIKVFRKLEKSTPAEYRNTWSSSFLKN